MRYRFETSLFLVSLPQCLQEVRRVFNPVGHFSSAMSSGDTDKDRTKIVNGMTIYKDSQLSVFKGKAGFQNIQIHKNWLCVTAAQK